MLVPEIGPEIASWRVGWSGPWTDTAPLKGGGGGANFDVNQTTAWPMDLGRDIF